MGKKNVVRVSVQLPRYITQNSTHEEKNAAFRKMFANFKKGCAEAGVIHSFKEHETYESPGRKRRRKQRESEIAILKAKIKENFTQNDNRK